jgi:Leucine Rich Repeat
VGVGQGTGNEVIALQDNQLKDTADLMDLTNLRKLDLDGNCLQSISDLSRLTQLTDLHVSRQQLRQGCRLYIDAQTLHGLSGSLAVLRISQCQLTSISSFAALKHLQVADFSQNLLEDEGDCLQFVKVATCLEDLDLRGNRFPGAAKLMDQVRCSFAALYIQVFLRAQISALSAFLCGKAHGN